MYLIDRYSKYSFVIYDEDTIYHENTIKTIDTVPNKHLTQPNTGEKIKGWVFRNAKRNDVSRLLGNYIIQEQAEPVAMVKSTEPGNVNRANSFDGYKESVVNRVYPDIFMFNL